MRAPRWLLAPALGFLLAALAAPFAFAQSQRLVVRDGTLGHGPLEVGPGVDSLGRPASYLITPELGEQRGSNLFHSFASFNIGTSEVATFTGPASVSNLISRVTGGDPSQINGTLRSAIPGADLWLLNPSGIVFGAGAQLDVSGSFHASTGDSLGFGADGLERFQADPSLPSVLSTAAPAAFGFLNESGGASLDVDRAQLAVPDGETLELVAGDVSLTGAEIVAPGGHVSLEALGAVSLSDSLVDVSGEAPGSVSIRAGRVVVEQGSSVLAENEGEAADAGGAITVATAESVLVDDSLLSVNTSSAGDAGTIHVESPEVTFQNGPAFFDVDPNDRRNSPHAIEVGASAETSGSGAGGTIEIDAGKLTVQNGVSVSVRTFGLDATGNAGTIRIDADSIDIVDRSEVTAAVWGSQGDAGAIHLQVADTLHIDGTGGFAWISTTSRFQFVINAEETVRGAAGTVDVRAGSIEIVNGGGIESDCLDCTRADDRPDDAGSVRIAADTVVLDGHNQFNPSYLSVAVDSDRDAGDIVVDAGSLVLRGGGIYAFATGAGNGGSITVDADSVTIESGGLIAANTSATGDAGSVTVRAESVRIGRDRDAPPNIGGVINAGSSGPGAAGAIDVEASDSIFLTHAGGDRFSLVGVLTEATSLSGVFSATVGGGGAGGSVRLAAPEITVTDGAIVATSTVGGGQGGSIELRGDRILVAGGGAVDSLSLVHPLTLAPGGDAGSVTLEASDRIEVVGRYPEFGDVSRVSSSSTGSGRSGDVTLRAPRILIDEGAVATTAVAFANGLEGNGGGSITIRAGELVLANAGQVNASTFIAGTAGSINVVGRDSILVTGEGSAIESRTGGAGAGGDVSLTAPRIEINDGGEVSARSEHGIGGLAGFLANALEDGLIRLPPEDTPATGDAGVVSLDASREVRLDRGTIATNAEAADGGNVTIRANELLHLDGSVITASVTGGTGGNITIDPDFVILQNGSRIEATAGAGAGGQIQITTDNFFAFPGSVVTATAGDPELSGTVEIHSPDVNLAGTLTALPSSLLDAASLMHERCAARRTGERAGSFAIRGPGGIPAEPDGWLRAPLLPELAATAAGPAGRPALVASVPALLLAHEGCP